MDSCYKKYPSLQGLYTIHIFINAVIHKNTRNFNISFFVLIDSEMEYIILIDSEMEYIMSFLNFAFVFLPD